MAKTRDHGGGLDAAIAQFGGDRSQWLDLSTGINPTPFPLPDIPDHAWTDLPDSYAQNELLNAARAFWNVPDQADIIATSGVSQLIAMIPQLQVTGRVEIIGPTYNEHAAAFRAQGWTIGDNGTTRVVVHPNNPDGRLHEIKPEEIGQNTLTIIDESFCDVAPDHSHIALSENDNVIILKGLGKFWGLAGLRLGFAIASPRLIERMIDMIGPWAVSGPAQYVGAAALRNGDWAAQTRKKLTLDAARLDGLLSKTGAVNLGGTDLFRLYEVADAQAFQNKLATKMVWSRIFPYSKTWIRLGLPASSAHWLQLEKALDSK